MRISYIVEHHWAGRVDARTFHQAPAAEYAYRKLVRDEMVAGWAGLDTQWGWDLCRQASAQTVKVNRRMPAGEAFAVSLPSHRGAERAVFRVER